MKLSILALAAATLAAGGAAATPRSMAAHPRLAPVQPAQGVLAHYEKDVGRVFRDAYGDGVALRAIVQPAFGSEYAVGLRRDGTAYEIFALQPSRQVWAYQAIRLYKSGRAGVMILDGGDRGDGKGGRPAELLGDPNAELRDGTVDEVSRLEKELPADPADLPLTRCSAPVDGALAARVTGAWRTMLEEVRPDEDLMPGLDGTFYHFSMEAGGRMLAGQTWTPQQGTRPARLARLAEAMRQYCETKESARLREIRTLAGQLGG